MSEEAGPSNYYQNYPTHGPALSAQSPYAPPESPYSAAPSPAYIPGSALSFPSTPSLPPPPSAFPFSPGFPGFPFQQSSRGSKQPRGTSRGRNRGGGTPKNRNAPTGSSSFSRAGPASAAGLRRTTRQSSQIEKFTTDGSRKVKLRLGGGIKGKHRSGHVVDSPYGHYDRGLDEDKEEPLMFEEQFILRVNDEILKGDPEAGVKGLREAVMSRKPLEGVSFKFKDDRRAVFTHGKKNYAAKLVDLPCIIEGQKVLENKRLFKVADISQMLVVGEPVKSEDQVLRGKLSSEELTWPDGLTPPLKDVRRERWRKKIDLGSDATVVDAVERLLKMDQEAFDSDYTLVSVEELDPEQGVEAPPAQTPREDYLDPAGQTPIEPSPVDSHTLGDRSRGQSFIDGGSEDGEGGGMREATVDAEQDIVKRFNERMQREADGDQGEEDEHDDLFGGSDEEEEEEEEGIDEVSDVEEDEEVAVDKEDQELIKQQNKLAEEINDLEDAVKRKRVEVQGKQNRTLRERANIQLQKMIKELDSKRAEHDQVIQKRESKYNKQPSPTTEAAVGPATAADAAITDKPEEDDRNEDDDEDSLFGDSEHEDEDPVEEAEDEDALGEPDDGAFAPTPIAEMATAEGMQVDAMDAVAEAVREQAAIAMATDQLPLEEQHDISSPKNNTQPIPSTIPDFNAHADMPQPSPPDAATLLALGMGRTTSQPSAAFDYEYSEPSASDSESDDD